MNALPADPSTVVAPELWMSLLKSASMLCVVLAVLIGVLFLVKKFFNSQGRFRAQGYIKLLASYHLAPKERIVLLDVLGEKVLVGITPQNISCLTKISGDAIPDAEDDATPEGFFPNLLKGIAGTGKLKTTSR